MRLKGVSELYVDIALALVVLSVSGLLVASFNNVGKSLNVELGGVGNPPLALLINYGGVRYLILVNYEDSCLEFTLVSGDVRLGSYLLSPNEVRVVNVDSDDVYVVVGSYLVRPEKVFLR